MPKESTLEQVLAMIRPGDVVVTSLLAMEPVSFLEQAHFAADHQTPFTLWHSIGSKNYPFLTRENRGNIDVKSWFYNAGLRESHRMGISSYQPTNLHDLHMRGIAELKGRVIFILSSPPMDRHGYFSSPLSLLLEREMIQRADIVIAEINNHFPRVHGNTQIHKNDIDYYYFVDRQIPTSSSPKPDDIDFRIGAYVSTLVEDRATIQLGIGALPDAIAHSLYDKKDLGIHTEMITNSMVDLVEKGVVTGKYKGYQNEKIVGCFAFGEKRLYDFLDDNPSIFLQSSAEALRLENISRNKKMTSINTCIQVDLTGQISSESIGWEQISGTGGQHDTAYGAIHSEGGKSIIALRSTALGGTTSTIVPFLSQGAAVTLGRNSIDYVVTENGIASLRGKTIRERAKSLIDIADEEHKEELMRKAKEIYYI